VNGTDGEIYGTCNKAGSRFGGNVFRLDTAAELQLPKSMSNGLAVGFVGIPQETYRLLRANNLSGPWAPIASITAGVNGVGQYIHAAAPATRAFYRVVTR